MSRFVRDRFPRVNIAQDTDFENIWSIMKLRKLPDNEVCVSVNAAGDVFSLEELFVSHQHLQYVIEKTHFTFEKVSMLYGLGALFMEALKMHEYQETLATRLGDFQFAVKRAIDSETSRFKKAQGTAMSELSKMDKRPLELSEKLKNAKEVITYFTNREYHLFALDYQSEMNRANFSSNLNGWSQHIRQRLVLDAVNKYLHNYRKAEKLFQELNIEADEQYRSDISKLDRERAVLEADCIPREVNMGKITHDWLLSFR